MASQYGFAKQSHPAPQARHHAQPIASPKAKRHSPNGKVRADAELPGLASRALTQIAILPVQMSKYMRQSPMKLYNGRLNDAGRFFSKP